MNRVFNFNAGPATLPTSVLEIAQKEFLDYKGTGMSIIETSHRAKEFDDVIKSAEQLVRELWKVPDNFSVLFLQGGASTQFFMAPMNIANGPVDYVITGSWSKKAVKEANILGKTVNIAYDAGPDFTHIPNQSELNLTSDAAYVHITTNNTIAGTQWHYLPDTNGVPIVADMSSDAMSYYVDFNKIGIIYAGAQKNLGPAGVTLVIVKNDLLERTPDGLPTMLQYKTFVEKQSLYNTPPAFGVYIMKLVLEWLKNEGGIDAIESRNKKKAEMIYQAIDNSNGFYKGHADKESRSLMNITFNLDNEDLEKEFVAAAAEQQLKGLKGHRSVGGIRASVYNAMSVEGCEKLVDFMEDFRKKH